MIMGHLGFRNLPLKERLILICILTTGSTLFLASIIFIATELVSIRRTMVRDMTGVGETIATNVRSALAFGDRKSAEEVLGTLSAISGIRLATVYDRVGNLFAGYRRDGGLPAYEAVPVSGKRYGFRLGYLDLYIPVVLDGETIGKVHMRSDVKPFYSRIVRYGITLLVIMAFSLLMSYLIFSRLQRSVTGPILDLERLMRTISGKKDYSVRAKVHGTDEIGYLAEGFNEMVATIETREKELEDYRKNLENLVEIRTVALRETNRRLQGELAERKRVEDALIKSERLYRTIFETTDNANVIMNDGITISMVNTAFEKLTGWTREEVEGRKRWTEFFTGETPEKMKQYREAKRIDRGSVPTGYETRFVDRNGSFHDAFLTTGVVPGSDQTVASVLDLTEHKLLEKQLRQSQKMEAIGQLAGGVAHDFNNILTAVIGYASLLRMKMGDDDPMKSYVDQVLSSAERATHLTQGLLAFSRKQVIDPRPVDLNGSIRNVERLLTRLMGEDIELIISYDPEAITILADSGQIGQILMNLATNARDSMADGGSFSIRTERVVIEEAAVMRHLYEKPGRYALISVSDTGGGMDKETAEHIFEPFFTTKEVGKGTGLGLSIVYGIVKQHGGYINVYSEPGLGTTFRIYFPLIKSHLSGERKEEPRKPAGGSETLLLAEDDPASRALIREVLEGFGYRVVESVDGDDAIEKFTREEKQISLVILDVVMPKKNGKIVYDALKGMNPDIKALFISGYTADVIHKRGIFEEDIEFLTKPVSPFDLAIKVRNILDSEK